MKPVSLFDLEEMAQRDLPFNMWEFVDAACTDEITKRRNRAAFDEISVNAKFLVNVGERDLTNTVLGEEISMPLSSFIQMQVLRSPGPRVAFRLSLTTVRELQLEDSLFGGDIQRSRWVSKQSRWVGGPLVSK